MPTPESAAAFAKLVGTRERLSEITKALNEAHAKRFASAESGRRYMELQKDWEEAFKDFENATDEFSAVVHRIHPPD